MARNLKRVIFFFRRTKFRTKKSRVCCVRSAARQGVGESDHLWWVVHNNNNTPHTHIHTHTLSAVFQWLASAPPFETVSVLDEDLRWEANFFLDVCMCGAGKNGLCDWVCLEGLSICECVREGEGEGEGESVRACVCVCVLVEG